MFGADGSGNHEFERGLSKRDALVRVTSGRPARTYKVANASSPLYTLKALLDMVGRRFLPMAAVFVAMLAATGGYVLMIPKTYEAELKLLVKRERLDAPLTSEKGMGALPGEVSVSEMTSEIELLKSRDILEKVAESCKLVSTGAVDESRSVPLAKAVRDLDKALKILPVGKTNFISLKYSHAEADRAAEVLNTLAALYLQKHVAVHRNRDTSEFFQQETTTYQKELEQAQSAMTQFQQKGQVSLLLEQKQATLRRTTELEAALDETESQVRDNEHRAKLLRTQLASMPATMQVNSHSAKDVALLERLKGMLIDLQHKRTELLGKYEPGYRLVKEVDAQIRDTQAALDREQSPVVVDHTDGPNPLRQSIEGELLRTETVIAGLKARRTSLAQDLGQYRARQRKLDQVTSEHDDLHRRVKIAEESYLLYQKKQEEARLADALDRRKILNVTIIEHAAPPALPADRHRSLILLLGLVAGMFVSFGAAVLADYFWPPSARKPAMRPMVEAPRPAAAPQKASPPRPRPVPASAKTGELEQLWRSRMLASEPKARGRAGGLDLPEWETAFRRPAPGLGMKPPARQAGAAGGRRIAL